MSRRRVDLVYQIFTRSASARIIVPSPVQPNACSNSGRFESGPRTRHSPGECGSVLMRRTASAGRTSWRQTRAYERKNRCSGVNPSIVVRGYGLPVWVGPQTLVVAASYSGDTEETLSCAAEALSRGCRPVCVTSGGRLSAFAAEHALPLITIPGGQQPRAAVGYLTAPLLAVLETAGLCAAVAADLDETVRLLRAGATDLAPEAGPTAEPAKALARMLLGHQTVVYGAGLTVPAARRWKGQINENAKAPSFWNELPELDHNELMGWTSLPELTAATAAVFLDDAASDERLLRRADLTALEIQARGVTVTRVRARGDSRLARLFSLVQLGDYVSFYLALLYGVDPTPVKAIQDFKAGLAGAAGA